MQINRLFEIIYILIEKKNVTARELAERFEVSTRTIYRDIETLSGMGIPVYMSKGKGGGISILPNFILNKTVITQNEKNEIISSLQALNATKINSEKDTLNKIIHLFGEDQEEWLEIDFGAWGDRDREKDIFDLLKESVLNKQVLQIKYISSKGESLEREIEPIKLCFKSGVWYLYAFCRMRKDYRFFKLKRIRKIKVVQEFHNKKAQKNVIPVENTYNSNMVELTLRFSQKASFMVFDEFEEYEELPDGSYLVKIKVPNNVWLFQYIVGFGEDCELLEPQSIRKELAEKLNRLLRKYENR